MSSRVGFDYAMVIEDAKCLQVEDPNFATGYKWTWIDAVYLP